MDYSLHNQFIISNEDRMRFYPPSPSGAFILLLCPKSKRILLNKRDESAEYQPNTWFGFGGYCESNETPVMTAIREMIEEANIYPSEYKLTNEPIFVDTNTDAYGNTHTIYIYAATAQNEIIPVINKESSDAKWHSFVDLSNIILFASLYKIFTDIECISKIKFLLMNDDIA